MQAFDDFLEIGVLGRPHGVRGELKLHLHDSSSQGWRGLTRVRLRSKRGDDTTVAVAAARRANKAVLMRFENIDSREAAQALVGHTLLARRAELPPLQDDEFYLSDLVGLRVEGPGGDIGKITGVHTHPSVDTATVVGADGQTRELVLRPPWFDHVDFDRGVVHLTSLDGFVE